MAHKGFTYNEHGVLVSSHICDTCGEPFTCCPPILPDNPNWDNCLAPTCGSYDPTRDFDLFFDDPERYRELHGDVRLMKADEDDEQ